MKQIFKLVGGRGVVSYVGYLKHHTVFFFERILRSFSLANCLPISLNLIAFVSTLQKATQMRFFMDKLIDWLFAQLNFFISGTQYSHPRMVNPAWIMTDRLER